MGEPTPAQISSRFPARLQEGLATLHAASEATTEHRKPVELDQQSVGRLSRMDAMQQLAMAAAQEARRHQRIRAVEAAIRRIGSGDFGWCDACGDYIGDGRLDLDPTLMRCRACAG